MCLQICFYWHNESYTWTKAINQGLGLYSLHDLHCSVQCCVVCIAVTCDSSLMIKENLCGGLCLVIYGTWCTHSCNALLLSNVAHRVNILAETFLIAIKKCLLSCLVGSLRNNDSIVARFARAFANYLGCLVLYQNQALWISTHAHALKASNSSWVITLTCMFVQREAEGEANVSSSSFCFPPSGCFLSRDLVSTVFQLFLQVIDHGCLPLHG